MRSSLFLAFVAALTFLPGASPAETYKDTFPSYVDWVEPAQQQRFGAIDMLHGTVPIGGDVANLVLPDTFYALTAEDARWVLETYWGNLPDPAVQALIFAKGRTPFDGSWAVVVNYVAAGHISDIEATTLDFKEILQGYRDSDAELNSERSKKGLPTLTTLGLGGEPGYDKVSHSLRFSLLLKQSDVQADLLNSNVWVLGRHGHVNLNVIGMGAQAAEINTAIPGLVSMITFTDGNRYDQFIPGVDTVSDGGLEALLGGGAAQVGIMVLVLAFLKKGIVLILLPAAWLWVKIKSALFNRSTPPATAALSENTPADDADS